MRYDKNEEQESINKIIDDETTEYLYQNDNYYKKEAGSYILTSKEDVYDKIEQNYLNLETINKYHLINENDHIVLGVSGGPDSTCLFHIFLKLQERLKLKKQF